MNIKGDEKLKTIHNLLIEIIVTIQRLIIMHVLALELDRVTFHISWFMLNSSTHFNQTLIHNWIWLFKLTYSSFVLYFKQYISLVCLLEIIVIKIGCIDFERHKYTFPPHAPISIQLKIYFFSFCLSLCCFNSEMSQVLQAINHSRAKAKHRMYIHKSKYNKRYIFIVKNTLLPI